VRCTKHFKTASKIVPMAISVLYGHYALYRFTIDVDVDVDI